MISVEIRGSGTSWACFHGGKQITNLQNSYDKACISALVAERRLKARPRHCLCCGAEFTSMGIGHRMCDACREDARQALL